MFFISDNAVILWTLSEQSSSENIFQEDEEENKESWSLVKVLR